MVDCPEDYGKAYADAEKNAANSFAARTFGGAPQPTNFRDELLQFAYDIKRTIKHYHGSFDIDSLIDPEISRAISGRIISTRRRASPRTVRQQQGRRLGFRRD
jgi:hypothetical protein